MSAISALLATWNAGGTTFTGIGINVTNSASAAASLLLSLQVGSTNVLSVGVAGAIIHNPTTSATIGLQSTPTWNASDTTFTGIQLNVTNTASAAGSLLLDIQVGGVSQLNITKGGILNVNGAQVNTIGSTVTVGIQLLPTWNNSGTQYTAFQVNAVNTASGVNSTLMDLQLGGTSVVTVYPAATPNIATLVVAGNIQLTATATMSNALAVIQTWNNGAFSYSALNVNVTNTASAAGAHLVDIQLAGTNKWSIDKNAGVIHTTLAGATIAHLTSPLWNAGGTTYTGLAIKVTNTASAAGSMLLDLEVGGTTKTAFNVNGDLCLIASNNQIIFGNVGRVVGAASFIPTSTTIQAKLADGSAFTALQGKLTTDTAFTATPQTPTGYITIYDSTGTPYKVSCNP